MFCNLDELMASLLFFLHYIINQFRNTCDKKFQLIPYNHFRSMRKKLSGKGDWSSASSVDLSRMDFRAMLYYDYCHGKSVQECSFKV